MDNTEYTHEPEENTEQHAEQNNYVPQRNNVQQPQVITNNRPNPNMVMAVVICFMLIIGVAFVFFYKLNKGGSVVDDESAEKRRLQKLINSENGIVSIDPRASTAALEGRISSILENASAIKGEFDAVKSSNIQLKALNDQLKSSEKGYLNAITGLGSEKEKLKVRNSQLEQLARNAQSYKEQAQSYANSNAEKDAIILQLKNRPSAESLQQLRNTLNNEQVTKADLLKQVEEMRRKMKTMVDSRKLVDLDSLKIQNTELREQLQALRTKLDFSKLFVSSSDKLPAKAQALYNKLKGLERFDDEQLKAAYAGIATDLNADKIQQLKFATGSSILNFTDQTLIKSKLDTTRASDYFLVVGYASKSGNAVSNQALSAKRATAVASVVNQLKLAGQDVRAVYLGQTSRFSKSINADNQLCEIWRIKK